MADIDDTLADNRAAVIDLIVAAERLPFFLRPLVSLYIKRILKKGVFPTGLKANKSLDPATGPATPAEARVRLEGAFARFDDAHSASLQTDARRKLKTADAEQK